MDNVEYIYIVKENYRKELTPHRAEVASRTEKPVTLRDREYAFGGKIKLIVGQDEFYWSEGEAVHGFIYETSLKIEKLQEEIKRLHALEANALLLLSDDREDDQ
ncbi:MAG TPA: hypothetical protein VLK82_00030 [Candidatus Tectomicrobia bacterium]|nr:hypothetical protein [Candidatus Tectomicrobia bacterium]